MQAQAPHALFNSFNSFNSILLKLSAKVRFLLSWLPGSPPPGGKELKELKKLKELKELKE